MKKVQDLFLQLIKIDSPFGQEKKMADFVVKELKKLNLVVKKDKFGNIVARSKKFDSKKSILLCAHLDTTESTKGIKLIIRNGIIYSDGKTILGADNKAAIAEIIHALQNSKDFSNVELLFTVQEENGLAGVKNLDRKLIKSKKALSLDHSFPPGCIVLKSPSAKIIEAKLKGEAIHGARANGCNNPINLSAKCISRLNFEDSEIKCNIGFISGGTGVNTSPDSVKVGLAIRSFSEDKLNKSTQKVINIFKKSGFQITSKRVGYIYSHNKNDMFIKDIAKKFKQLNIKTKLKSSFGLSDANVLNRYGIKTIEIGYGPQKTHTKKEFVKIKDMENMSNFLSKFF